MTQKTKSPPLPSKGGSYTVDGRNKLKKVEESQPAPAEKPKKDVTDA